MQNILLEVKSVRRCENGHTCNLIANGRKVAFVGPGIFEWLNYSKKVDVLTWFASRSGTDVQQLQPVELKDGWESETPDYRLDDARHEMTETALHEWIILHFKAYEIIQRCKFTVMSIGAKGEILDWSISPKSSYRLSDASKPLNGLSMPEIVNVLQSRTKPVSRQKRLKTKSSATK